MEEKKNILTREGLKRYEDELHELKVVRRKEVAQKIKEAREQGDLSENAEYDAAKDEQRDIEARIEDLEKILKVLIYGKIRTLPDIESIRREKNERMKKRIHDAGERLVQMQRSREKISRDLFQAYESFKEGLTGKGTYLQQKTAYEEMMDKLSENISRQERAIAEMEVPQEEAGTEMTVPELKKHLILDRNFSDLFIRQITVYADRHIDVRWNFCEE